MHQEEELLLTGQTFVSSVWQEFILTLTQSIDTVTADDDDDGDDDNDDILINKLVDKLVNRPHQQVPVWHFQSTLRVDGTSESQERSGKT